MLKKLLCFALCGALLQSNLVKAADADDEEAQAEKEKAKRDQKIAEDKAKKEVSKEAVQPPAATKKDEVKPERLADDPFEKFTRERRDAEAGKPGAPKGVPATAPGGVIERPAPVPNCPVCLGTGILPLLPYKPYVRYEGEAAPKPEFPAFWKYCDKCRAGIDVKTAAAESSAELKERQERAREKQKKFDEDAGKKLSHFETPFVSVHSMLTAAQNKKVADALEKCAGLLQANSKSMVLVATRADEDDIVFLGDEKTYGTYIDKALSNVPESQREMAKKSSGLHVKNQGVENLGKAGSPAENRAVFNMGRLLMDAATDGKAKPWLSEGFSAYCENATLGMNTIHTISYELGGDIKFGKNWNDDLKKLAKEGKLKPWDQIFNITLEHLNAGEYLHLYGMVSFLIKLDPQRFDKFVLKIKEGEEAGPAIEEAYGRKLKEIYPVWGQWIMTQK